MHVSKLYHIHKHAHKGSINSSIRSHIHSLLVFGYNNDDHAWVLSKWLQELELDETNNMGQSTSQTDLVFWS